jgi:ABC-type transporter Mla subunit MlaD
MSNYRKNLMVGLTITAALLLLAYMIVKFGDMPARLLAKPQFAIHLTAERADGLGTGSPVIYRGVQVGRVSEVRLEGAAQQQRVVIDATIDQQPPLPGNLEGAIVSQIIGGSSVLTLRLPQEQPQPQGVLQAGAHLRAHFLGVDVLPPEFAQLAEDLRLLSKQFRESKLVEHLDQTVQIARKQIEKVGKVIDSVESFVTDDRMRQDLRQAAANFRSATDAARNIGDNLNRLTTTATTQVAAVGADARKLLASAQGRLDDLSGQVSDRLVQVSRVLEDLQVASRKLSDSKGTAGKLLNNAELYEALLDSSRSLNSTILDLQRLVRQWEQEGVYFKLSGKK